MGDVEWGSQEFLDYFALMEQREEDLRNENEDYIREMIATERAMKEYEEGERRLNEEVERILCDEVEKKFKEKICKMKKNDEDWIAVDPRNKNTLKGKAVAMKRFEKYLADVVEISVKDFLELEQENRDTVLTNYVKTFTKKSGSPMKATTFQQYIRRLRVELIAKGVDLFDEKILPHFNRALDLKTKDIVREKPQKTTAAPLIENECINVLFEKGVIGVHSPTALLNFACKVFFFILMFLQLFINVLCHTPAFRFCVKVEYEDGLNCGHLIP